jgi:hypothetical protein
MNLYSQFANALPLADFLKTFGSEHDRQRWKDVHEQISLTDEQRSLLAKFRRETHVLVLAGAWCGDCVRQCPIFEHFAGAAPWLKVRYLDRDVHAKVQDGLSINGGRRVPVVVFFSEDGYEVSRFGDRTLAAYRRLANQVGGGGVSTGEQLLRDVIQDWLNEFERVQWLLQLSPRLRQMHGD